MSSYDWDEEGPYVVIERSEPGVGSFVLGIAIGAGLALLFAPRTGEETRRELQRRARKVGDQAQDFVAEVSDSVTQRFNEARLSVEDRIDSARQAVEIKRRQVTNAVGAGRAAAQPASGELVERLAGTEPACQ